jgi:hypothetical protein
MPAFRLPFTAGIKFLRFLELTYVQIRADKTFPAGICRIFVQGSKPSGYVSDDPRGFKDRCTNCGRI